MDNNENKNTNDEMLEAEIVTLLDEDNNEIEFEVIGGCVVDGVQYFALIPAGSADDDGGFSEYIILKSVKDENGEEELIEIEDDAEFEDDGYGEGFDPDEAYGEPEYLSEDDFDDKDSK